MDVITEDENSVLKFYFSCVYFMHKRSEGEIGFENSFPISLTRIIQSLYSGYYLASRRDRLRGGTEIFGLLFSQLSCKLYQS